MATSLVNIKNDECEVYIGRGSIWGNEFSQLKNTKAKFKVATRQQAIVEYRNWITSGDGRHLLPKLEMLRGKVLGCYCKPLACHGEVLLELLGEFEENKSISFD